MTDSRHTRDVALCHVPVTSFCHSFHVKEGTIWHNNRLNGRKVLALGFPLTSTLYFATRTERGF